MKAALSDFQVNCRNELIRRLSEINRHAEIKPVTGKSENFIEGVVLDTDIKFWIYEDGADFSDPKETDERFENPDYNSLEDLMSDFLNKLIEELKRRT